MSKTLVAFFSASGSTSKLAHTLAGALSAELYEIRPAVPYVKKDLNWMDQKSRTTVEMKDPGCRPALANTDAPVADADVVFLGFPIWWYREPSIIDSFLEAVFPSGGIGSPASSTASWRHMTSPGKPLFLSSLPVEASSAKARSGLLLLPKAQRYCPANVSPPVLQKKKKKNGLRLCPLIESRLCDVGFSAD